MSIASVNGLRNSDAQPSSWVLSGPKKKIASVVYNILSHQAEYLTKMVLLANVFRLASRSNPPSSNLVSSTGLLALSMLGTMGVATAEPATTGALTTGGNITSTSTTDTTPNDPYVSGNLILITAFLVAGGCGLVACLWCTRCCGRRRTQIIHMRAPIGLETIKAPASPKSHLQKPSQTVGQIELTSKNTFSPSREEPPVHSYDNMPVVSTAPKREPSPSGTPAASPRGSKVQPHTYENAPARPYENITSIVGEKAYITGPKSSVTETTVPHQYESVSARPYEPITSIVGEKPYITAPTSSITETTVPHQYENVPEKGVENSPAADHPYVNADEFKQFRRQDLQDN